MIPFSWQSQNLCGLSLACQALQRCRWHCWFGARPQPRPLMAGKNWFPSPIPPPLPTFWWTAARMAVSSALCAAIPLWFRPLACLLLSSLANQLRALGRTTFFFPCPWLCVVPNCNGIYNTSSKVSALGGSSTNCSRAAARLFCPWQQPYYTLAGRTGIPSSFASSFFLSCCPQKLATAVLEIWIFTQQFFWCYFADFQS